MGDGGSQLVSASGDREAVSEPGRIIPLASGRWLLARSSCHLDGWAFLSMFGAVPAVLVVENLVSPGLPLELYEKDRLYARSFARG
jgi:hypothetical protein